MKIKAYTLEVEVQMRHFYHSLSEKDRRRYAAVEAKKLGYGGITYICKVLGCDAGTVTRGLQDLEQNLPSQDKRIRKPGGGRKSVLEQVEGIEDAFLAVVKNNTAGSPMDESIKWTNLSRRQIAEGLAEYGFCVSVTVVDKLLDKHNFRRRQAFKAEAGKKNIPHRDEQFKKIEVLKQQYYDQGNPVMSMDVKKKN